MSTFPEAPGAFRVRLRRMRRSAWLLIGLCFCFQLGQGLARQCVALAGGPALSATE